MDWGVDEELQTTNSKTIRKTEDKRTEDNERIIRVRFPRNHLGQEMCLISF